jgi:electron transport complex protein RnfD
MPVETAARAAFQAGEGGAEKEAAQGRLTGNRLEDPLNEKANEKQGKKASKKAADVGPRFLVSSSPHLHDGQSIAGIMKLVIIALMPATLFSIYIFGLHALRVIVLAVASALIFEALSQRIMKRPVRIKDYSAALTGLLLALNLPATSPWWLVVVGSFFAIVIAKQIYGGLGYNPFNPALVGRVVLLISFPVQMTARWVSPSRWGMNAVTTATPLGRIRESLLSQGRIDLNLSQQEWLDLLLGNRAGCLGEVSVVLLLAGGIYLIAKRVISWHTPVAFIGTVWILTGIFHLVDPSRYADPSFHVITGGLFIGAFFMATDYVTSPITGKGMLIFGAGCGLITVVIRLFGAYPEGVSFAILLMNAATPLIDRYVKPKVFGAERRKAAA